MRRGAIICDPESSDPHRIKLTEHDQFEVDTFSRFLEVMGTAPDKVTYMPKGWVPYVIGEFFYGGDSNLSPPIGYDDVPVTAWTFPG